MPTALALALTPHGRLHLAPADDAVPLDAAVATRLAAAFARGSGHGLLQLGAAEVPTVLPPVIGYWRDLGARFVTAVCGLPDVEELRGQAQIPALPEADAEALALAVPPMVGGEYVTAAMLTAPWTETDRAFRAEIAEHAGTVQEYLARRHPAWHLVGRVHFNLAENRKDEAAPQASLLVAPASLLVNWVAEIGRFAPSLRAFVAHPSVTPAAELKAPDAGRLDATDLVITSYGTLLRLPWLMERRWRLAILDEAQAIKNPGAKQTRVAKRLGADARVVLTGTPVENRLGDLWSIFDFLNPGLLGGSKEFGAFVKRLAERPQNPYAPLRDLVRPYILRRLKTDKTVIADLPDKTEVKAYCPLSRKQAALCQEAVKELAAQLEAVDGMKRRGMVLAFLMRLKQICNHPSQWLGDGAWAPGDSGKLGRLREIAETIAAASARAVDQEVDSDTSPASAYSQPRMSVA